MYQALIPVIASAASAGVRGWWQARQAEQERKWQEREAERERRWREQLERQRWLWGLYPSIYQLFQMSQIAQQQSRWDALRGLLSQIFGNYYSSPVNRIVDKVIY